MASAAPETATSWATKGSSKLPGTQCTEMSFSAAPWRIRASMAPLSSRWETISLNRATTIDTRMPVASTRLSSTPPSRPSWRDPVTSPAPHTRAVGGREPAELTPTRGGRRSGLDGWGRGPVPGSAGGVGLASAASTARVGSKWWPSLSRLVRR